MKSKTFCSNSGHIVNKTVLVKNITLYWPIWAVYMLYLLVKVPIGLSMALSVNIPTASEGINRNLTAVQTTDLIYINVENALSPEIFIFVSFIMAAITGMALYSYMFTAKSANWYHSLPLTRGELYFTNVFSGLLFMWVPQLITFIVSILTCISNGIGDVKPFADWFLMSLGVSLLFWAMVTFCAMFTGQMFALPVYYVVINFLYVFFKLVFGLIIGLLGFGLDFNTSVTGLPSAWLSPLYYLTSRVGFVRKYIVKDNISYVTSLYLSGEKIVAAYAAFGIVLLVLAAFLYRKRNIEGAGDLLTFAFIKPVFRWGAGFCGGFGIAIMFASFLKDMNMFPNKHLLLLFAFILGIVSFFIAEMFIQKKFRVFCRQAWKECGLFGIFLIIIYCGLAGYSSHKSAYIPDSDEIETASITMDYEITFKGNEAKKIVEIQEELLDNRQSIEEGYNENNGIGLSITYVLKDGEWVRRYYSISPEDAGHDLLKTVYDMECDSDNYKQSFQEDYLKEIKAGRLSLYDENIEYQNDVRFTKEEAEKVYSAILKDIDEGRLQKYNLSFNYLSDDVVNVSQYTSDLSIEFYTQNEGQGVLNSEYYSQSFFSSFFGVSDLTMTPYSYSDGNDSREIYFSFGPDCINIINALIDIGAINSADDLYTYPSEAVG